MRVGGGEGAGSGTMGGCMAKWNGRDEGWVWRHVAPRRILYASE